jgi:exopolysaccharide biosynthesis polyprenyl glycosylphosphotransferase
MKNNANLLYAFLLIVGDFLALLGAFSVAYILRVKLDNRPLIAPIHAETFFYAFLAVLPLWILVHATLGLYKNFVYDNRFREFGRLVVGSIWGMLVVIGYDFVTDGKLFPARLVAVYGFLLGFSFLVIFRTFARSLRTVLFSYGIGVSNLLVIGSGKTAKAIVEQLGSTRRSGYRIIGLVGNIEDTKLPQFSNFAAAVDTLQAQTVHSIMQTKLYADEIKNGEILTYAQTNHISYRFIPGNDELFSGNIQVELFSGYPVVSVHQTALTGWGRVAKRLFDLLAASVLLVLSCPLFLLIALLMKLTEPRGPLLFRQARLTKYNRVFTVYKFRTIKRRYNGMSPETAFKKMSKPELITSYRENGDHLPNDPRFTRLGRLLRVSSVDELPQFWNVIKGDLSLVGPRALVPEELDSYQHKHHILSVKSGVTGLAQVSGRRDISYSERRKLDLYYVQNWSFWLDLSILLRTVRAVINGVGAK